MYVHVNFQNIFVSLLENWSQFSEQVYFLGAGSTFFTHKIADYVVPGCNILGGTLL